MDILADLDARGLIHDSTDRAALDGRLRSGPITLYCGFDPTADSLHVGNLIGLLTLRRFQLAGHNPISLAGGATGMVGDPTGRSSERTPLDDDGLARNLELIVPQLRQFLDFSGPNAAKLVDNRAWTVGVSILEFLRDIGRHVTVNQMVAKESVKARMSGTDGISYTEFTYMLLQAYDYAWLAENEGCELQVGGSDQWGNIVLGVDLIRRRLGKGAHAITWPLLLKPDGTKYGKTAGGDTIWLGAHKMSPYRFYQGWMAVEDNEVRKLLLQLTFKSVEECHELADAHEREPGERLAQKCLATELTELVHGAEATAGAAEASELLFSRGADPTKASAVAFDHLASEIPTTDIDDLSGNLVDALVSSGLAESKGDARRAITEGGIYLNGERVGDADQAYSAAEALAGGHHLLRRGKKRYHLLRMRR